MALMKSNDPEIQGGVAARKPRCEEDPIDVAFTHLAIERNDSYSTYGCRSFEFTWDGAAKDNVYVAGEFDDWEGTVKLECRGDIFTKKVWIIGGPDKDVSYKFIVDGVWKYCPAQPQITDNRHNINNVLRLERMRPPEVVAPNRTARPSAPKAITVETPVAAGQYEAKRPPGGIPALFWWPVIIVAFSASLVAVHWWTQKLGA